MGIFRNKKKLKKGDVNSRQMVLVLFTLFFPTILIMIPWYGTKAMLFKLLIAFYQFIVIKAFIDTFYGENQ